MSRGGLVKFLFAVNGSEYRDWWMFKKLRINDGLVFSPVQDVISLLLMTGEHGGRKKKKKARTSR